ncbi:MAG TPA: CBS domain-containing protein [Candidatus Manganitrophaceae bacterium]|nr:CBS domain-containing protein [Candidatus Manganitrophaceae bacterium]
MQVKEVMSPQTLAVDYNRSCSLAAKLMAQHQVSSVLVRKGEDFVGILTEADIVRRVIAEGRDPVKVIVDTVMSFPIYTIDEEATIDAARRVMSENQTRHLVATRQGKPVGIFSARNLIDTSNV